MLTYEQKKIITARIVDRACDHLAWQGWDDRIKDAAYFGRVSSEELKAFSDKIKRLVLSAAPSKDYFDEGHKAFHDGAEFDDCPDQIDAEEENAWKDGWTKAMENPTIART